MHGRRGHAAAAAGVLRLAAQRQPRVLPGAAAPPPTAVTVCLRRRLTGWAARHGGLRWRTHAGIARLPKGGAPEQERCASGSCRLDRPLCHGASVADRGEGWAAAALTRTRSLVRRMRAMRAMRVAGARRRRTRRTGTTAASLRAWWPSLSRGTTRWCSVRRTCRISAAAWSLRLRSSASSFSEPCPRPRSSVYSLDSAA